MAVLAWPLYVLSIATDVALMMVAVALAWVTRLAWDLLMISD